MKKENNLLTTLLLVTALAVACIGGYIKYGVLQPLGIESQESVFALPFVMLVDEGLQFQIQVKQEAANQPTEPSQEAATAPAATQPSIETPPPETTALPPETEPAPTEVIPETTATAYVELEDSWFDDALFIGDSRTAGMRNYYRLGNADYFTNIGMNIYNVFTQYASDNNFPGMLLEELLQTRTYGKIYIGIGLNECNYDHEYIEAGFARLLELIRQYQPDAKIILQSIMMVSEQFSKTDACFSQENLNAINDIIRSFCDDETVFYIDYNEVITDEQGYLPADQTFDGIHLFGTGYEAWAHWIKEISGTLGIA